MKKFIKKMKGKKVLSIVLAVILLVTTFSVAVPMLKLGAEAADITIGGVSQTQIVTDTSVYGDYAAAYLNGASRATDIVVPGLNALYTDKTTDQDDPGDYVIQGMSYYPEKDWMLVTAYHSDGNASSKIFALDAATGDFVAMFDFENADGSVNYDHGGGIAVSEHNLYYACGDKDQKIAYAPLSEFDVEVGTYKTVTLLDSINLYELGESYTAYVCYDEGVLWAGNFYDAGASILGAINVAADYNAKVNGTYNSMVFGYKLAGNSSEEEWDYLKGKFRNLLEVATASGSSGASDSTFSWTAYKNSGTVNIAGTITAPSAYVGEFTGNFGSFTLTEGVSYTIEFTSNYRNTDLYMFSPAGTHCNVKQSSQTTITEDEHGRYHFEMNFTAGLKPTNADSSWPTTQSTDGTYTGTYTLRFDQDAIAAGESREFEITNIKISQTNTYENAQEKVYDEGSAGSPTYAIGLNNSIKDVQYAVVDNGKLYLSRSYGSGAGNSVTFGFGETSTLTIADIDLSIPGSKTTSVSTSDGGTKTINVYEINNFSNYPMMPMSEGLCVVNDNIFITFESASNKYLNESSGATSIGNCEMPVDVVWQLDPYALMEMEVPEPENSIYYEKVNSISEIEDGAEYLIVHKSEEIDPVTQRNVLYALDADGGLKEHRLSKSDASVIYGYNGMIGHEITEYSIVRAGETDSLGDVVDKDRIYLDNAEKDDIDDVRWTLESIDNDRAYKIKTTDSYYANCNCLYFDEDQITMSPSNASYLNNIKFMESGNGNGGLWLSNSDTYFLWSNDGLSENYYKEITSYYIKNGKNTAVYSGLEETDGTFHTDALNSSGSNIIGGAVETGADTFYADGVFYLYKRVKDDAASTYESRVYTDLNAELQADGTYTIDLETYAISPNHYQYIGEKPTDYIIVADTSSSMSNTGSTGIASFNGELAVSSLSQEDDTNNDGGVGVKGYGFTNPGEDIYYLHTDGKYYQVKMAVNTVEYKSASITDWDGSITQRYWAYYVADDGLYYVLQTDGTSGVSGSGGVFPGITQAEFINHVDNSNSLGNDSQYSGSSTKTSNGNRRDAAVYNGPHYRFDDTSSSFTEEHLRIDTLKNAASNLVGQIASENSENRIALVRFGGSTGFYNTSGTLSTSDYANAFWSTANASELQSIINNLTTSDLTSNDGIEFTYVNNLMSNSGKNYVGKDKERNVAVIFFSDGVAGADDQSDTTTAANAVISKALEAKKAGAFVYTVIIGADGTTFDKKLYMDAVSSKYAEATSMTDLGGQNVDGVNYTINLATTTINNFVNFGEVALEEVSVNNAVGLDNLNASSILREELSDAFIVPTDEIGFETYFVKGTFDAIGRFAFDEEGKTDASSELTIGWDPSDPGLLTVSGYDYSSEYIAQGKEGRKLQIRITGVLANPDADLTNTSINNTATTAIYKTSSDMTATGGNAFKKLPTVYFNIPKYTYVLDYGLQLLDTDVNGTLKAVSAGLTKQDVDNYIRKSENGLVAIQAGDQNLLYHTTPTNTTDSGYVLIQRDSGEYDWFEIEVVPASNVYFEETEFATTAGTGTVAWSTATGGTSVTERNLPGENDVYGFDNAYDNTNTYSNGTTLSATVDSTNKRSKTATVSFAGDGIDIISACGPTTGMQIINIKNAETGKSVAASIVDTYYADATFSQVPVFSWRGSYGEYTVETTAVYLSTAGALKKSSIKNSLVDTGLVMNSSDDLNTANIEAMLDAAGVEDIDAENLELVWFDDNSVLNGGSGVAPTKKGARADSTGTVSLNNYLDGFRIYNPLGSDSSDYAESEQSAVYYNVIDSLVDGTLSNGDLDFTSGTVAFVTGSLADGETLSFSNYESIGPKNELYLRGGASTGVAFNTPVADGGRVMVSLRAVNGTATATINGQSFTINSATEMYYDITDLLTVTDGKANVSIINTGSGILAVNNIKLTNTVATSGLMLLSMDDLETVQYYASAEPVQATVENGVVTPVVEEEAPEQDTSTDNNDTTTDSGETEESFSIFSLIEALIAFIREILFNTVGSGKLF